jgi:hypothetical protein
MRLREFRHTSRTRIALGCDRRLVRRFLPKLGARRKWRASFAKPSWAAFARLKVALGFPEPGSGAENERSRELDRSLPPKWRSQNRTHQTAVFEARCARSSLRTGATPRGSICGRTERRKTGLRLDHEMVCAEHQRTVRLSEVASYVLTNRMNV